MKHFFNALLGSPDATAGQVKAGPGNALEVSEMAARLAALDRSQAVIEFKPGGEILTANENFLATVGYSLDEIRGQHHSMFVEPAYARSAEYRAFWENLDRGEFHVGLYKRLAKGAREVWIHASYVPLVDADGKVFKVVKYASDVTEAQLREADLRGQVQAIDKSQAVIQFTLDGTILDANANFLSVVGYTREEIVGKHHSMFVEPAYKQSDEYRKFWAKLAEGKFDSGQYKRLGKDGKVVWIQASYNPIFDATGKPIKVVKFAQDITAQIEAMALDQAVAEMKQLVQGALSGDLSGRIPTEGKKGDVLTLSSSVNQLVDEMEKIVARMRDSAVLVTTAAKEISSGNTDLSSRTEEQASSLEETASAMEELTSTVKQNAENARQANQLAAGASDVAVRGGEVVRQVVSTMGAISASSKKIADIISVIDGIAFQTNILALNAAVEAARAGEQGRGFAVVATEVRNLAQRSATAAKEIKDLIGDSVAKVDSGSRLVDEAGKTMDEIVASVKKVTGIMAEIADASLEQSRGIEQVNEAITQVDDVTQQNAALVEQAAAAAESLEEQARSLAEAVSRYRLSTAAAAMAEASADADAQGGWEGEERRGPDRARNVTRLGKKPAAKAPAPSGGRATAAGKTAKVAGGDDDWQDF
ncbi:MAG: methyl-accepting chemotaxis protein [Betaproteobacteria bacterium]|jgi:methyl-accepting chemotaxis protein